MSPDFEAADVPVERPEEQPAPPTWEEKAAQLAKALRQARRSQHGMVVALEANVNLVKELKAELAKHCDHVSAVRMELLRHLEEGETP